LNDTGCAKIWKGAKKNQDANIKRVHC